MTDLASDILTYGLAAGLSGSAFLATIVLLATDAGARAALGLLAGVALVLVCAAVIAAVVSEIIIGAGGSLVVATLLKLALGLLLLALAWRVRPGAAAGPALRAKLAGMESKLAGIGPEQAVRIGVGVAVLPRRLGTTLLAGATIGATQTTVGQSIGLLALYVLTATVLIWGTLVIYMTGGDRARDELGRARAWVIEHIETVAFVVGLLFGLLFTGQAVVELVA